jgi:ketosteroid isomerase-like protein
MHPNEALARRELEALESGDMDALTALYSDDFVLHYPGRSPLAGDHRGFDEFLAKVRPLMGEGGTVKRELHDAFGSDDHAVQLLTVTATTGDGRSHTWQATIVMHVDDGKISEAWAVIVDQYALDGFLNSLSS